MVWTDSERDKHANGLVDEVLELDRTNSRLCCMVGATTCTRLMYVAVTGFDVKNNKKKRTYTIVNQS